MRGNVPSRQRPVSDAEFAVAMSGCAEASLLAAAVSGGSDSLALMLLAARFVGERGMRLAVLTVDHGTRPETGAEALLVAQLARERGLDAVVLENREPPPRRNRQAALREIRYRLLCGWCREQGVDALLLGHQLEDQAETFLLRLIRGSGVDGLAAMSAEGGAYGVRLYRPLLGFSRARLRAVVAAEGVGWAEDPSNEDAGYARSRVRGLMESLAAEGLDARRLAKTAASMARARAALEAMAEAHLSRHAEFAPGADGGVAHVSFGAEMLEGAEEIVLRALARVLMEAGGREYRPRFAKLENLLAALRGRSAAGGRCLHGCRIFSRGERVFVFAEACVEREILRVLEAEAGA